MTQTELKFEWDWRIQMNSLILLLESGNEDGKRYAREELLKLAKKLDEYNFSFEKIK
jgi:hypothetical protein